MRVLDLGTRIAAPFCAGLLGEQGAEVIKIEQPARRRLHARDRSVRRRLLAVLGGRRPRPQERDARPAHGRRPGPVPPARGDGRRRGRELPPRHARALEHRPRPSRPTGSSPCASRCSARTARTRSRPGLDRVGIGYGGLLHLTGYPDRPPVRVGVTISDYLTGVFAAQAAVAALYARDARGAGGAVIDAALYGSVLRILEWTLPAYDRLGTVRSREGNRLANSAPLDNYPTRRRQVRVHRRRLRRQLRPAVQGHGAPRPARRSALRASSPTGPRTATRSTASSRSGPRRSTRATIEERCVAHDVPVATAYTVGRHLRRPALRGTAATS